MPNERDARISKFGAGGDTPVPALPSENLASARPDSTAAAIRHGSGPAVPVDALLWDDPELALVHADPQVYTLAHPCECEALCQCDTD